MDASGHERRDVSHARAARAGELTLGHSVNLLLSVYAFDYVLYPVAIWKLGLLRGGAVMSCLSLITCLLMLRFYDWSRRDWLGIEAIKAFRDGEARTRFRRLLAWALQKGDVPACVALSLWTDPFITTAFLRRGAYNGMKRRDWTVFLSSWFISNGSWALACFGGVEVLLQLGRWARSV